MNVMSLTRRRGGILNRLFSCNKPEPNTIFLSKYQASKLICTIVNLSSSDESVISSMNELYSIACVQNMGYEDRRYIITTHDMQLLRKCTRWNLIKQTYHKLFQEMYIDLDPSKSIYFYDNKNEYVLRPK